MVTAIEEEKSIDFLLEKQSLVEYHQRAAKHIEAAAKHHLDAARHCEAGNLQKASRSVFLATIHINLAVKTHREVTKKHILNRKNA